MKRPKPLWLVMLCDLVIIGLLLLVFAYFHHGRAYLAMLRRDRLEKNNASSEISEITEESEETQLEEITEASSEESPEEEIESSEEESVEEIPDTRTEWQKKYEEHFTDDIVITDNHYSSPNICIDITEVAEGSDNDTLHYYIADIYVGSIDCFRTYLAGNKFELYRTQSILGMSEDAQAILAMTGDFYSYQFSGIMVRNGREFRRDWTGMDICALFTDGTLRTYGPDDYTRSELLEEDIWQLWDFGPSLLTADGEIPTSYNISDSVKVINPRSALGYYEPGHYCFVVVDGRQWGWSDGMTLTQLSQLFYDLGCTAAYNLDGGGSAIMAFDHRIISRSCDGPNGRELGDALIIAEPDTYDPELFVPVN